MLTTSSRSTLGPRHHGRKMSLKSFEFAQVDDGYVYELARGYIVVSEVPNFSHMRVAALIRRLLDHYFVDNPDKIFEIVGNMECKVLIPAWESERHPDIAIYLSAPKGPKNRTMWRTWIPELVVEVVSESSRDRDYTEKRDEYWTLGVKEYWIVDAQLERILVLKRGRSQWTERMLGAAEFCESKLLPGFRLECAPLFQVGREDDA